VSRVTISFIGQCHTVGYPGVPPDSAFPEVCRRVIQASRPDREVKVHLQPYWHPAELTRAVKKALRSSPSVVVIEVVGWLAVTGSRAVDLSKLPSGVGSAFERARYLRHVATTVGRSVPVGADLIYRAQTSVTALASGLLRPLLRRYPRPTVAEYEICVEAALDDLLAATGVSAVIQGPGAPNLTLERPGIAPDAMERYRAVREMARRVAERRQALFVDRWDTVSGGFFIDDSVRPTAGGHSVWGQLLASELLHSGLV
jgi:hypothetical protein